MRARAAEIVYQLLPPISERQCQQQQQQHRTLCGLHKLFGQSGWHVDIYNPISLPRLTFTESAAEERRRNLPPFVSMGWRRMATRPSNLTVDPPRATRPLQLRAVWRVGSETKGTSSEKNRAGCSSAVLWSGSVRRAR